MTTWRSLIIGMRDTQWSWQEADVADLCRRMGWTSLLGEPTDRRHTKPATVRWRLDHSTVLIENVESAVTVTWASNRFQDEWDRVTDALA